MSNSYIRKIVLNGMMIALVFLATYFTHIPTPLPGGYFNLGDTVIIVTAFILGKKSGLIAGAIGSFLADIAYGAFIFAPITFIVKGLEGFAVGALASAASPAENGRMGALHRALPAITGAVIMVGGYFIAEAFILALFNEGFGLAAAIAELPVNLVQGGLSAVLGCLLSAMLASIKVREMIR